MPTAFSPFPPVPARGFHTTDGGCVWLPFFGGQRPGPWAACPACGVPAGGSFAPVAMQTQPLVIPAPSPRPRAALWPWVRGCRVGVFWPCCFSFALCLGFTSYLQGRGAVRLTASAAARFYCSARRSEVFGWSVGSFWQFCSLGQAPLFCAGWLRGNHKPPGEV